MIFKICRVKLMTINRNFSNLMHSSVKMQNHFKISFYDSETSIQHSYRDLFHITTNEKIYIKG